MNSEDILQNKKRKIDVESVDQLLKERLIDYRNVIDAEIWDKVANDDSEIIQTLGRWFPNDKYPACTYSKCLMCKKTFPVLNESFSDTRDEEECVVKHKVRSSGWDYQGKIMYKNHLKYGYNAFRGNCKHCGKMFFGEGCYEVEDVDRFVKGCCYVGVHITDKKQAAKLWNDAKDSKGSSTEDEEDEEEYNRIQSFREAEDENNSEENSEDNSEENGNVDGDGYTVL